MDDVVVEDDAGAVSPLVLVVVALEVDVVVDA